MASSSPKIALNQRSRGLKTNFLRLSDVSSTLTTDYAEIVVGSGAPSGAYGRDSSASMLYIRTDASSADVVLYVTHDGGTAWNAVESSGLGADAGLTSLIAADAAAGLPYVSAANTWANLTLAADKGIRATSASALATYDLTAAGLALLDDANAAAQLTTLGVTAAAQTILDDASVGAIATTLGLGTGNSPVFAGINIGTGNLLCDFMVRAVIAVADVTGGGTDAALTVDLFRLDGSTVLGGARQVMIAAGAAQYQPQQSQQASVTFGSATKGSIIASGTGWCLAETDADGEFDCTVTNSDDETLYFWCKTASKVSDSSKGCVVVASNSDSAAWSA